MGQSIAPVAPAAARLPLADRLLAQASGSGSIWFAPPDDSPSRIADQAPTEALLRSRSGLQALWRTVVRKPRMTIWIAHAFTSAVACPAKA